LRQKAQPFQHIFKEIGHNFYKIDPNLFAPAKVSTCNLDTGNVFEAGTTSVEILKRSIGLKVA